MCRNITLSEHEVLANLYGEELPKVVARVMDDLGVRYWQKRPDHYLIWFQWGRKYGMGFSVVVGILVKHYRKILRKEGPSLGIGIATLTGEDAEGIIRFESQQRIVGDISAYSIRRKYASVGDYAKKMDILRGKEESTRKNMRAYRGSRKWGFGE